MNSKIFFGGFLLLALTIAGFRYSIQLHQPEQITRDEAYKHLSIMQCSPDWTQLNADSLANGIGVLPGWGNYRWNIQSQSDSARFYFNQGINMYYAFHIIEAMASFKKAERFDDQNAMIYWAQALAYGPNINDFGYRDAPEAFAAAQKAQALEKNCTPKEKALIGAMVLRYSDDTSKNRATLNQSYADAMKKAYDNFRQDADVSTLYADALMLQHPWDYWKHNGQAQAWTPELLNVLEYAMRLNENHPGANHYYIHAIEASPNSSKAMASANRLGTLMPGVAHMIHMPSHIYIRNGQYAKGIKVNEMSVKGYNDYLAIYPEVKNNVGLYLIHNLHMQADCSMMAANYTYSNITAFETKQNIDTSYLSMPAPFGPFIQYMYMTPWINNVRFGKWDEILNSEPVNEQHVYASAIWHWARAMAFAGKNKITEAETALNIVQEKIKSPDMLVVMAPFNAPADAAKVAVKIAAGIIALKRNNYPLAISLLKEGVVLEDALIYNEPKDWLLPSRQYLGAALLQSGNASQAAIIFKEDLKENPSNHWSLYGLHKAYVQQQKISAAKIIRKQFDAAFTHADIKPGVKF